MSEVGKKEKKAKKNEKAKKKNEKQVKPLVKENLDNKNKYVYLENNVMTQYDNIWIKKNSVEDIDSFKKILCNEIIAKREDKNTDETLSSEELKELKIKLKKKLLKAHRALRLYLKKNSENVSKTDVTKKNVTKKDVAKKEFKNQKKGKPSKYKNIEFEKNDDLTKFQGLWVTKEGAKRLSTLKG